MATQADRAIELKSPLGEDALLFRAMTATEMLGRLFEFELDLLSTDHNIALEDILGQNMTVRLDTKEGGERFFNGFVSRFSYAGTEGDFARYEATMRPWLWFLTRTSDCRIFQGKTVVEIIEEVFAGHSFGDYDTGGLTGAYRTWNYCVQYRETDFNFISRLLEQEGIYYYFRHDDGKHTLVLADSLSAHEAIAGHETIAYYPPTQEQVREEHINGWSVAQEVQPGAYALNDYDFTKPKAGLLTRASISREHEHASYEIYDYPGEYSESADGDNYTRVRIEELQAQHEVATAQANTRGVYAGGLFTMTDYPRDDQNREYLIVAATHELEGDDYVSGEAASGELYSCRFNAIESKQPYRTPRTTPKPAIQGPQSALVVGKSGDEIWTDEHGRVKVQFYWDREGKADENSSCWVRVSQYWAGKNWGSIHIPRIGQEVLVDFEEGDPDRPIITGRVYNADLMPPYTLPANKTQSGLKSRSTKEGNAENFNEIRFEDKKGEEQLYIHAEKDQVIVVENDESHSVGNDRSKDVANDETTTIGNNRTESVGKNENISIGANRSKDIGENETVSVGENRTESIGKDESVSVGANRSKDVGKDETISIGANRTETVGKKESVSIGDERKHDIGKDDKLNVGKKLLVSVGDEIVLKTGSASITMKKDGTITIKGKDLTLNGSGKINIKASKDVTIKGSKVKQN